MGIVIAEPMQQVTSFALLLVAATRYTQAATNEVDLVEMGSFPRFVSPVGDPGEQLPENPTKAECTRVTRFIPRMCKMLDKQTCATLTSKISIKCGANTASKIGGDNGDISKIDEDDDVDVDDLGNDASVGRRGGSLSTSGSFVVKGMVANRAGNDEELEEGNELIQNGASAHQAELSHKSDISEQLEEEVGGHRHRRRRQTEAKQRRKFVAKFARLCAQQRRNRRRKSSRKGGKKKGKKASPSSVKKASKCSGPKQLQEATRLVKGTGFAATYHLNAIKGWVSKSKCLPTYGKTVSRVNSNDSGCNCYTKSGYSFIYDLNKKNAQWIVFIKAACHVPGSTEFQAYRHVVRCLVPKSTGMNAAQNEKCLVGNNCAACRWVARTLREEKCGFASVVQ